MIECRCSVRDSSHMHLASVNKTMHYQNELLHAIITVDAAVLKRNALSFI